jgi:hypothetical protein
MSLVFFESGLNGTSSLPNIAFTGNAIDTCGLQVQLVLDRPEYMNVLGWDVDGLDVLFG